MDYIKRHKKRDRVRLSGDWAEWIVRFAKRYAPEAHNLLDIGSGRGVLVHEFNDNGINAYGIELRNIFEFDKSRMGIADVKCLPFKDKTFDMITEAYMFSDMLELQGYNNEGINAVAKEALRVLRPGGYFITHPGRNVNLSFFGFQDITKNDYWSNKGLIAIYRKPG